MAEHQKQQQQQQLHSKLHKLIFMLTLLQSLSYHASAPTIASVVTWSREVLHSDGGRAPLLPAGAELLPDEQWLEPSATSASTFKCNCTSAQKIIINNE